MSAFDKNNLKQLDKSFIGRLAEGNIVENQFGGAQLDLHIQPLDHETKGNYREFLKISQSASSKLAHVILAFDALGYQMDTTDGTLDVGQSLKGAPVGEIFVWTEKELEFGSDMAKSKVKLPTKHLTQAQADAMIQAQGGVRRKGEGNGSTPAASTPAAAAPEVTDEQRQEVDDYILEQISQAKGVKKVGLTRIAATDEFVKEYPSIKKELLSGAWLERQVKAGALTQDGDTYLVTADLATV